MNKLKKNLQLQVIVPLVIALLVLSAAAVYVEYYVESEKLRDEHLNTVRRTEWLMYEKIEENALVYAKLSDQICSDLKMQEAFLTGDRQKLKKQIDSINDTLKTRYNVAHLCFKTLEQRCVLKEHSADCTDNSFKRYTLVGHDRPDGSFYGVEMDPSGTFMLRYCRPWYVDEKQIGYVELRQRIEHVTGDLKKIMNVDTVILVEKPLIDRSQWTQQQTKQGLNDNWDLLDHAVVVHRTAEELPEEFIAYFRRHNSQQKQFCRVPLVATDDKNYVAGCYGLTDIEGTSVGRMVVIKDVGQSTAVIMQTAIFYGAMTAGTGFIASIFFYFYIGRIGKRLEETDKKQRIEILHRRFAETQLNDSKERAEAANEAKSKFLSNMSHELRTPMNAIVGFSDLLSDEPLNDEQLDYVQTIQASSKHLLTLINDVLDLSKIEANKLEIVLEHCHLADMLGQVESMMRGHVESKGLALEVIIDPSVPDEIVADTRHLYQCLINLVANAVKFTSKGHVRIRVNLVEDEGRQCVQFDVEDSGIGIPTDRQGLIFESFQQADSSTSRKYGGTGLGLTITRRLIDLMGGSLSLASWEGEGSTFSITLPLNTTADVESA